MPAKGTSAARRQAIAEILHAKHVRNQGELRRLLEERGFAVTQSSVSRDLAEIGTVRVDGQYMLVDELGAAERHSPRLVEVAGFILEVAAAGPYLLAVKTPAGLATSVALALDEAAWPEIVGTVAGDDTFFVATAGRRQQARVYTRMESVRKEGRHA